MMHYPDGDIDRLMSLRNVLESEGINTKIDTLTYMIYKYGPQPFLSDEEKRSNHETKKSTFLIFHESMLDMPMILTQLAIYHYKCGVMFHRDYSFYMELIDDTHD